MIETTWGSKIFKLFGTITLEQRRGAEQNITLLGLSAAVCALMLVDDISNALVLVAVGLLHRASLTFDGPQFCLRPPSII